MAHTREPTPKDLRAPEWQPLGGSTPARSEPTMQELQPCDIAVLADLGLRFGVLEVGAVVAWADSIIAREDEPPYWAIQLALAKPDNVHALLSDVPGSPAVDIAQNAFLAFLRCQWESGYLSINDVHVIGRKMHFEGLIPGAPDGVDWGIVFDSEFDEYEEGRRSEKEMRDSISKKLSHYAPFEQLIPSWLSSFGAGNLSQSDRVKLYRDAYEAVHDVLIHEWDPIGVGDEPMAQDEYDSYIPSVLRMLTDEHDEQAIADHLEHVETVTMGLSRVDGIVQRNLRIARRLREVTTPFQMKHP